MPISNGYYTAPTWVNQSLPAINASELQAITDSLETLHGSSAPTASTVGTIGQLYQYATTGINKFYRLVGISGSVYNWVLLFDSNNPPTYTQVGADAAVLNVSDSTSAEITIAMASDNTIYSYGTLTSLTITAYPSGNFNCIVRFTAGTGCTISLPASTAWNGNIAPTITAGNYYEISISNGNACFGEF